MKKTAIVIMVALLSLAAAGIIGCGGNTGQAKEDMKKADAAYSKLKKQLDELQATMTGVLGGAVMGNYAALTQQTLDTAMAAIDKVLAESPAVAKEYRTLAALEGVPDYTEYANAMIKAIEANDAALGAGRTAIGQIKPLVEAGNTAAIAGVLNQAEIEKLQSLSDAATQAYEDAQAIKTEKKLGE